MVKLVQYWKNVTISMLRVHLMVQCMKYWSDCRETVLQKLQQSSQNPSLLLTFVDIVVVLRGKRISSSASYLVKQFSTLQSRFGNVVFKHN